MRKSTFFFILTITIVNLIFFARLFYPTVSLFSTPDFGQSDIWQLNLPAKQFLSESLHNREWPVWNPYIGNGYPHLAEGQMGTFVLSNLLFFRFLPFVFAFNMSYVVIFLTASFGMFAYSRLLRVSPTASVYNAFLFTFSAIFVTHISHMNLIQTGSYIPWIFFGVEKIIQTRKIKWGVFLSLVLSQQIFAGFPQLTFITLFIAMFYFIFRIRLLDWSIKKVCIVSGVTIFFVILGFLLCSIQLFPQKEFLSTSTRSQGLSPEITTQFSFPFKHFLSFINPYALGNPSDGSYPDYIKNDGSIFWENTGYIGVIPILFGFLALLFVRKNPHVRLYSILLLISALFMLGKYSPLYFLFPIPPFSFFRVPSRFIWMFVFSIILLSSFYLDTLGSRLKKIFSANVVYGGILIISITQLFLFSYSYNPILKAEDVLKTPGILSAIHPDFNKKIYTLASGNVWNQIFLTEGWKHPEKFLFFLNAMQANQNSIYKIPAYNTYRAQTTRRYEASLVPFQLVALDDQAKIATLSAQFIHALQLYGVGYLISPYRIEDTAEIKKTSQIPSSYDVTMYTYEVARIRPQVYMTNSLTIGRSLEDFYSTLLYKETTEAQYPTFVESIIPEITPNTTQKLIVSTIHRTNQNLEVEVSNTSPSLLVINQTYYPGWQATIDGTISRIVPVNINQVGLALSSGSHKIKLVYIPSAFQFGKIITLLTAVFLLLVSLLQAIKR